MPVTAIASKKFQSARRSGDLAGQVRVLLPEARRQLLRIGIDNEEFFAIAERISGVTLGTPEWSGTAAQMAVVYAFGIAVGLLSNRTLFRE